MTAVDFVSVYPMTKIFEIKGILSEITRRGFTIVEIIEAIESVTAAEISRMQANSQPQPPIPKSIHSSKQVCPHCGQTLVPVVTGTQERVMGCKRCRYSKLF